MAEITRDGRHIIHVPFHGRVKVKSFPDLRGVSNYIRDMRQRLGDQHQFVAALTDEYGRFQPIRIRRGLDAPDDAYIPLSEEPRLPRGQRPPFNRELIANNGQVALVMPRRLAALIEQNYDVSYLEDDPRLAAKRHVSRYLTDDNYRACVDEETAAVAAFNAAATPAADPTIWGPHLPARPPRLWVERDPQTETDPAVFLGTVYKDWLPWLSRRDIRYIDRTLYFVYAQWLSSEDPKWLDANGEKSPAVVFGGNPRGRMDDAAYGANARERDRQSTAKSRETKRANHDKPAGLSFGVR